MPYLQLVHQFEFRFPFAVLFMSRKRAIRLEILATTRRATGWISDLMESLHVEFEVGYVSVALTAVWADQLVTKKNKRRYI